jgi:putative lipase involved disintegration of autophagic bodies
MTGHSLGGGIAKIVAAKLGLPILAISAPGVFISHRIFGIPTDTLDSFEVNLYMSDDIVPLFDRLQGTTFQMRCLANNPLLCHDIGTSICELVNRCGNRVFGHEALSCVKG